MTKIRLDAATLAKFREATGPIVLCDEAGTPVIDVEPINWREGEPRLTPEELQAIRDNPVRYKLADAWDRIRRGEKL